MDRLRDGTMLSLSAATIVFFRFVTLPEQPAFELCGFHWITGRPCPLCGMTRALGHLAKGDWNRAIELHALSPVVFAFLVSILAVFAVRSIVGRPRDFAIPGTAWTAAAAVFGMYGVSRWF